MMLAVLAAGQQSMRWNSTPSSLPMGKVLSALAVLAGCVKEPSVTSP